MADAKGVTASIRLGAVTPDGQDAEFAASGRVITFPGFLRAYVESTDDDDAEKDDAERRLPRVARGDALEVDALDPQGHTTSPPARYTEASLVKRLEELGIGRPSTYASIITTVQDRGYVWKKGSALVPTWLAFAVVNLMEQHFGRLVDYGFTVSVEDDLDTIAGGDLGGTTWLSRFYFGSELGQGGRDLAPGRPQGAHRQEPRRDRRARHQHHPDRPERGRPSGRRARRPLRAVRPGRRRRRRGPAEGLAARGPRAGRAHRRQGRRAGGRAVR
jgi:hypothetical protein